MESDVKMTLRIHSMLERSRANGPGLGRDDPADGPSRGVSGHRWPYGADAAPLDVRYLRGAQQADRQDRGRFVPPAFAKQMADHRLDKGVGQAARAADWFEDFVFLEKIRKIFQEIFPL